MPSALCPSPRPAAAPTRVTCIEVTCSRGCAVDDALDRLHTLAGALGMTATAWSSEGASVAAVHPADRRMAAAFGGRLVIAGTIAVHGGEGRVWTGPAFVPRRHLLSAVPDGHHGIAVTTADGHRLLHVLPGGVATCDEPGGDADGPADGAGDPPIAADPFAPPWTSSWLVRLGLPHTAPHPAFLHQLLVECGVDVVSVRADVDRAPVGWARVGPCAQAALVASATRLARTHRCDVRAWRVLDAGPPVSPGPSLRYPRARCLATS
jgi:hypothetical protein